MPRVSFSGAEIEALLVAGRVDFAFGSEHATLTIEDESKQAELEEMKSRWRKNKKGEANILLKSEQPGDLMANRSLVAVLDYVVKRGVNLVTALDIVLG